MKFKSTKINELSYSAYYQPVANLGGDFYNTIKIDNYLIVYLVDITGPGLEDELLNIFIRETINNFLLLEHDKNKLSPKSILKFIIKRYHQQGFSAQYFICLLLGVLDLEKMKISFINAGFQFSPIIVNKDGEVYSLDFGGMPISTAIEIVLDDNEAQLFYQEKEVSLEKGSTLLLTTDGLLEESIEHQMYGEERLIKLLSSKYFLPPKMIINSINKDIEEFAEKEQGQDDITFVVLQREFEIIDQFYEEIESSCRAIYEADDRIIDFVSSYCDDTDFISIGLQEILTNAVEHGNKMKKDKKIKVQVSITQRYILLTVEDEGEGFDWKKKMGQELDIKGDFEYGVIKERGRGVMLTNMSCDYLWYNDLGNKAYLLELRD